MTCYSASSAVLVSTVFLQLYKSSSLVLWMPLGSGEEDRWMQIKMQAQPRWRWWVSGQTGKRTVVLFRIVSALKGGVRWRPELGMLEVHRNIECWWFCPEYFVTTYTLNARLVQWLSFLDMELHCKQCSVWSFSITTHCPGGIGQKTSCNDLNLKWERDFQ